MGLHCWVGGCEFSINYKVSEFSKWLIRALLLHIASHKHVHVCIKTIPVFLPTMKFQLILEIVLVLLSIEINQKATVFFLYLEIESLEFVWMKNITLQSTCSNMHLVLDLEIYFRKLLYSGEEYIFKN